MARVVRADSLGNQMTGKERLAAALRLEEVDRVPWAPKVFIGHYRSGTSSAQQAMAIGEFADVLNCDAIAWNVLVKTHQENVTGESVKDGPTTRRITRTPVGEIASAHTWSEESHTYHPTEFALKGPEDYKVASYIAEHTSCEPITGAHEEMLKSVGDRGIVVTTGPGTPLMTLIQGTIGMPQAYYHLTDYQMEFDELFEVEADCWCRYFEALAQTDAEYVCIQENTSSTLVSPDLYERYCLPLKKKACEMITAAGKHCMLHMCGCLKDLLPQIQEIGADSWESFTPPPIGDTLFKDGREVSPDRVCLIGGMNAVTVSVWDHGKVLDYVDETLDSLPHTRGVVFTSGGAMPVECPVETLATLGKRLGPHLAQVKN